MLDYVKPQISIVDFNVELLSVSDVGPGATDIGAPTISNECKSVWDEEDTHYLNKKEENYEVYE